VCCVVGIAGCSSGSADSKQPPGSLPIRTAQVVVNGQSAITTHEIRCTQDGWAHTVEIGDEKSGVKLVVETGSAITAKSVVITNMGGFNGHVWEQQIGQAKAEIIGTTFRVSGTAEGATIEDPNHPATAAFDIKANC
jgi:hypothetical protein